MMSKNFENKIIDKFKDFGSIPLLETYLNCNTAFEGICKCGNIFEIKWSFILVGCYPLCKKCSKKLKIDKIKKAHRKGVPKSILKKCEKFEAIPIESTYKNNFSKFKLFCKCGNIFELKGKDIQQGNSIPHCRICSKDLKIKKLSKIWHKDEIKKSISLKCSQEGVIFLDQTYRNNKTPFEFICKCGKKGKILWGNAIKKERGLRCIECNKLNRLLNLPRGENHPNYDKNISDIERERNRSDIFGFEKDWAREVKIRAKFLCAITNQNSNDLVSHHLYNWWHYPFFRVFVDNGVCIKRRYHNEFHKYYGKGHNTYNQFNEFFKFKTGFEFKGVDLLEVIKYEG